jgi:N6-adenosine-specific RNA methylase IME4
MLVTDVPAPPCAGSYCTVLADPPWLERGGGKVKRGADRHYPLMSTSAIAALPVVEWAAPDAHLYLWVTNNFLEDGLMVMRAWGFRYVSILTWKKDRIGLGQYFRGNTEHCLFGVRGSLPYRITATGVRAQGVTGFDAPRGKHSVKPEYLRLMAGVVSYEPRLELFARRPAPGWDVWGNEVVGATR